MLCATPVPLERNGKRLLVGCGKCQCCRVNKLRAWSGRILMEGVSTEKDLRAVSWCTLTYRDENLPHIVRGKEGAPLPTLDPTDYQRCFKRLRKRIGPFRFALVGEYGEKNYRPHYHALLYGPSVFHVEQGLKIEWAKAYGFIQVRPWRLPAPDRIGQDGKNVMVARARYIAGYVTKKMSSVDDPRLKYRHPEFWRCSRTPGLGHTQRLVDLHYTKGGRSKVARTGDCLRTFRIGGETWPLGQTTLTWLRGELGIPLTEEERDVLHPTRERPVRVEPTDEDYENAKKSHRKMLFTRGKSRRL